MIVECNEMIVRVCVHHDSLTADQCNKDGLLADGTQGYRCKACYKEIKHQNYLKNKDAIRVRTKSWRINNLDRKRELNRESYLRRKSIYKKQKQDKQREAPEYVGKIMEREIAKRLKDIYGTDDIPLNIYQLEWAIIQLKRSALTAKKNAKLANQKKEVKP